MTATPSPSKGGKVLVPATTIVLSQVQHALPVGRWLCMVLVAADLPSERRSWQCPVQTIEH